MTRRLLLAVAVLAAVTATAAAYYRSNTSTGAQGYMTAPVIRGSVVDAVEATGSLEAVTTVQVGTQVSGTIKALHADFNSRVRRGQVIAELEPSLLQAQVQQAEAAVVRLQADVERARIDVDDTALKLQRARELWDRQLIARTDLEAAEAAARQAVAALASVRAQVTQAQAALDQSRVNLGHAVITAPIDGIVISRDVDVGQTVAASMSAPTLFVIAEDLSRMRVNARIDESDIGRIVPGQAVTFTVDAYPADTFSGTVSQVRLAPVVESNVVSYVTIIDVPNPDQKLKPGMTATVSIEVARVDDVLRVPNAALRFQVPGEASAPARQGSGSTVHVLDDTGRPRPVPVEAGLTDGIVTAIQSGGPLEHTRVITGMAAAGSPPAMAAPASPLLPFGGRRPSAGRSAGGRGGGG